MSSTTAILIGAALVGAALAFGHGLININNVVTSSATSSSAAQNTPAAGGGGNPLSALATFFGI